MRFESSIAILVAIVLNSCHGLPSREEKDQQEARYNGVQYSALPHMYGKRALLETNGTMAVEAEMAEIMKGNQISTNTLPVFLYRGPCSNTIPFCDTCSEDGITCYSCQDGYVLRDTSCGCLDPRCSSCPESSEKCESCSDSNAVINKEFGTCECKDGYVLNKMDICESIPKPSNPLKTDRCLDPKCSVCTKSPDTCEKCQDNFMLSLNKSCIPAMRDTSPSSEYPQCEDTKCKSCPKSPQVCESCQDPNAVANHRTGRCECRDGFLSSIRGCLRNPFSNIQVGEEMKPSKENVTVEKEANKSEGDGNPESMPAQGSPDPQVALKPIENVDQLVQETKQKNSSHPGFDYVNIRFETSTPDDVFQRKNDRLANQPQDVSGTSSRASSQETGWLGKKKWRPMSSEILVDSDLPSTEDAPHVTRVDHAESMYNADLIRKKQMLMQMLRETDARIEELESNET